MNASCVRGTLADVADVAGMYKILEGEYCGPCGADNLEDKPLIN